MPEVPQRGPSSGCPTASNQVHGLDERRRLNGSLKKPTRSWPCPRPARFAILVVHARDDLVLQLGGTLDLEVAETFCECVEAAVAVQPRRLILELSGLDPLDLVGVECFRTAARLVEAAGIRAVMQSPAEETMQALDHAGLLGTFTVQ
jgi:anti-anti-sigma factor